MEFCHLIFLVSFFGVITCSQGNKFDVGGKDGWVLNPSEDYAQWSGRNRFQVNDILYFKYKKGSDSVLVVNKDDYNKCDTKNPIQKLEDGDSEFKLDRSGPFFFISGKDENCKKGQKLSVVVLAVRTKPNPPTTSPGAHPPTGLAPVSQPPTGIQPISPYPHVHPPPASPPTGSGPVSPSGPSPQAHPPPGSGPVSPSGPSPQAHPPPGSGPVSPSGPSPQAQPPAGYGPVSPSGPSSQAQPPAGSGPVSPSPYSPGPSSLSPSPSAETPTTSPVSTPSSSPPSPNITPTSSSPSPAEQSPPSPPSSTPAPAQPTPTPTSPTGSPSSSGNLGAPPGSSPNKSHAAETVTPSTVLAYSVTLLVTVVLTSFVGGSH